MIENQAMVIQGIAFATRILRPSLETLIQRAIERGRDEGLNQPELFKANAQHPAWIVDNSSDSLEQIFEQHFCPLVRV
ncbi:MAG: hypothetical protein K2W82_05530 [Candidatus Obscuribacterales bacterium]|nr:hypothetical protein [Candidatus Obscuribacterales bacterium]